MNFDQLVRGKFDIVSPSSKNVPLDWRPCLWNIPYNKGSLFNWYKFVYTFTTSVVTLVHLPCFSICSTGFTYSVLCNHELTLVLLILSGYFDLLVKKVFLALIAFFPHHSIKFCCVWCPFPFFPVDTPLFLIIYYIIIVFLSF